MPKVDQKQPVASAAAATAKPKPKRPPVDGVPREIIYPDLSITVCHGDGRQSVSCETRPALTGKKMAELMNWMTEKQYTKYRLHLDPSLKEEYAVFPSNGVVPITDENSRPILDERGKPLVTCVLLEKDENGDKVICLNNCCNRPFDEATARKYAQDVLNRNWAGPTTLPGETINGEMIEISRYGQVISGQHRGVGLILAWQIWLKQRAQGNGPALDKWPPDQYPDGPVMDTPVFFGISEDPRVLQTLDNVRPRSTSDVVYSSPIFASLNPEDKKQCSRMMDAAVDLLWQRTGAGKLDTAYGKAHRYQTHSESMDFIRRHEKLQKCVKHLRYCDRDGAIRTMGKLSAGKCAAIMYMMACSESDYNSYHQADPLPNEKVLTFSRWEEAKKFWQEIKDGNGNHDAIREAVSKLIDEDGTRDSEKFCLLAKAWNTIVDPSSGGRIIPSDLDMEDCYVCDDKGNWSLGPDAPGFGGIDLGPKTREAVGESEASNRIEKDRQERSEQLQRDADARVAAFNRPKGDGGGAPDGSWVPPSHFANGGKTDGAAKGSAPPSPPKPAPKPSAPAPKPAPKPTGSPTTKLRGGIG